MIQPGVETQSSPLSQHRDGMMAPGAWQCFEKRLQQLDVAWTKACSQAGFGP